MAVYKVYFKESIENDLKSIPKKGLRQILQRISALSREPRPFCSEKLSDQERYRIRQGKYRVIYSIQDDELTVWIVKVGSRQGIYRRRKE